MADTKTTDLIRQRKDELERERDSILTKTVKLREQRDALNRQREELNTQIKAVTDQINAIERPRVIEIADEISRLSVALGGRRMSESVAEPQS